MLGDGAYESRSNDCVVTILKDIYTFRPVLPGRVEVLQATVQNLYAPVSFVQALEVYNELLRSCRASCAQRQDAQAVDASGVCNISLAHAVPWCPSIATYFVICNDLLTVHWSEHT